MRSNCSRARAGSPPAGPVAPPTSRSEGRPGIGQPTSSALLSRVSLLCLVTVL